MLFPHLVERETNVQQSPSVIVFINTVRSVQLKRSQFHDRKLLISLEELRSVSGCGNLISCMQQKFRWIPHFKCQKECAILLLQQCAFVKGQPKAQLTTAHTPFSLTSITSLTGNLTPARHETAFFPDPKPPPPDLSPACRFPQSGSGSCGRGLYQYQDVPTIRVGVEQAD